MERSVFVLQPRAFILLKQDIRRFQVAVNNTPLVGGLDCPRESLYKLGSAARKLRLACDYLVQARAIDILQGQERPARVLADLVDLHDIRVAQTRCDLRLGAEAGPVMLAGVCSGKVHFQSYDAVQTELAGFVNDA